MVKKIITTVLTPQDVKQALHDYVVKKRGITPPENTWDTFVHYPSDKVNGQGTYRFDMEILQHGDPRIP